MVFIADVVVVGLNCQIPIVAILLSLVSTLSLMNFAFARLHSLIEFYVAPSSLGGLLAVAMHVFDAADV